MRVLALATAALVVLSACSSQVIPISGTPTADAVLGNARRVARDLESYRALRTTTETTRYPKHSALDRPVSRTQATQAIEVASTNNYRVVSEAYNYEQVRLGETVYSRLESGEWEESAARPLEEYELLPGESPRPPSHPYEWLDSRYVVDTVYTGQSEINGTAVYVIEGVIPMLPAPALTDDLRVPSDNVTLYIDASNFQVIRIEIDQNIHDSLREDIGYQVIPGVVEIETRDVIDFSDHNAEIEIKAPGSPSAI